MKEELENAPPEPRESAAREAVESSFREWMAMHSTTDYIGGELRQRAAVEFALAYSAELRAERDTETKQKDEYFEMRNRATTLLEASERSFLQAREALESLKLPKCGDNASLPIEEVCGCGQQIHTPKDLFRCGDCEIPFHRQCLQEHFAGNAASTSAPEGE